MTEATSAEKCGTADGAAPGPAKPRIELVVEDIDNTKYDFFGTWAASFTKALETLATQRVGHDPQAGQAWMEHVKTDIRRTAESGALHGGHIYHDFAEVILRTPALNPRGRFDPVANPGGREELTAEEQQAVTHWQRLRQTGLKPFDGVRDTLRAIRAAGARDVAWTDAPFSSLAARMPRLFGGSMREAGVERVYCQPDDGAAPSKAALRAVETAIGAEVVVLTPEVVGVPDTSKPSREAFEYILAREAVEPRRALIVGDHFRDFVAAQWRDDGGRLLPGAQRPLGVWQKQGADGERLATRDGTHAAAVPARALPLTLELLGEARLASYPLGVEAIGARIGNRFVQAGRDGDRSLVIAPPDLEIDNGPGAKGYRQLLDLVTMEGRMPRQAAARMRSAGGLGEAPADAGLPRLAPPPRLPAALNHGRGR